MGWNVSKSEAKVINKAQNADREEKSTDTLRDMHAKEEEEEEKNRNTHRRTIQH